MRTMSLPAGLSVCLFSGIVLAADLPLGERTEGSTSTDSPAVYSLETDGPGVLTVVVRADDDVVINVMSPRGRLIDGGHIDIDFEGDAGAEQGTLILSQAGEYEVRVEPYNARAGFVVAASWLSMAEVARRTDPMGSPDDALDMEVNQTYAEQIDNTDIDHQDWYRFVATGDGLLTVATKSESGDLILACYGEGDLDLAIEQSDRDIGGNTGREAMSLDVSEGDVYYFVVSAYGNQADYTIRAVLTDN